MILVEFWGVDGSGKATQIALLGEHLRTCEMTIEARLFGPGCSSRVQQLLGDSASAQCEYVGPAGLKEKMAQLEQADLLILLSQLREGQPICVLEGFHFGLRVVATESGGHADLVNDNSGRVVQAMRLRRPWR